MLGFVVLHETTQKNFSLRYDGHTLPVAQTCKDSKIPPMLNPDFTCFSPSFQGISLNYYSEPLEV